MKYPFEKLFLICTGDRCRGDEIRAEIKEHNKKLGRKASVRVCSVSCLDLCEVGPNMVVEPDGTAYSHLDRKLARAVYDGEMGDGPRRPDLEFDPADLARARKP